MTVPATFEVGTFAEHYPGFIKVFIPNNPRLIGGQFKANSRTSSIQTEQAAEDNKERSLRRAKKRIIDYVLCNDFKDFCTFTFKSDRTDILITKSKMSNWVKNQKRRKGSFAYLLIPEFHADKKSLHFHALISGYSGELKEAINPKTGSPIKRYGRQVYTIPSYTLGFTTVQKIKDTLESREKLGSYLAKYITKDLTSPFGKKRYWASKGLLLPRKEYNPQWLSWATPIREPHQSEHGLTLIYPVSAAKGFS